LTIKAAPSCKFGVCGCTGFRTEPQLGKDGSGCAPRFRINRNPKAGAPEGPILGMGSGLGAVCGEYRESGFFEGLGYFC